MPEVQEKLKAPKDYQANLLFRAELLQRAGDDVELQAHLKELCRIDDEFFFDMFLWTFDPRVAPFDLPFITYNYEVLAIKWIRERIDQVRDGHCDKSRDMGATWTFLGKFFHDWLFEEGFLAHLGSKTEDDVDRTGDMKSLFEKLRYFCKKMPDWMMPNYESRFMRLINNDLGTAITGESANKNWARQGRYRVCFYDEFAVTEYADDIWTAAGDSAPSRIVVGTPNGTGNKFWKLRFKEMPSRDLFRLHWTLHPKKAAGLYKDKNGKLRSPWYDNECLRRSPQEVAQEIDINYLASGNPFFNIEIVDKQEEWPKVIGVKKPDERAFETGVLSKVGGYIRFRVTPNGPIRVFERPIAITQAAIASDPAEGLAHRDMSAIAVRDKKFRNLLAGVYGDIPPDELAEMEWLLSLWYNEAICTAEMGGYGLTVNTFLWEKGANVFRDVDTSKGDQKTGSKLGFNTKRHRLEMLALTRDELDNEAVELRDRDLKMEAMNFINKAVGSHTKPQASAGSCDDYIFAYSMAGFLIEIYPFDGKMERETLKPSRRVSQELMPPNQGFRFAKGKAKPMKRFMA